MGFFKKRDSFPNRLATAVIASLHHYGQYGTAFPAVPP
jgi:hypothetical protein